MTAAKAKRLGLATAWTVVAFVLAALVSRAVSPADELSGAAAVAVSLFTIATVAAILWLWWSYIGDVIRGTTIGPAAKFVWVVVLLCLWPFAFPAYWLTRVRRYA